MSSSTPIYAIAKELEINSNRIILACKSLGINAKGATKKLNKMELEKVISYFKSGKNVSEEIIDIDKKITRKSKSKPESSKEKTTITYFKNRLIGKS